MKEVNYAETEKARCSADGLVHHVWNHMHGYNMDGSRRKYGDDQECARNGQRLSDAIGEYLHEKDMAALEASKPELLSKVREILNPLNDPHEQRGVKPQD